MSVKFETDGVAYTQVYDGEWVRPRRRSYYMACCDCGLIHRLNFRLVETWRGKAIEFQAFREPKKTAKARRQFKHPFQRRRK